jgi:hypothetical protein
MITIIIQHDVKDFAEWKKVFDADLPSLKKAGVKLLGLYTSVKDAHDVTLIFEAPSTELFDVLNSDPERQAAIKRAGVISAPVVKFLNRVSDY